MLCLYAIVPALSKRIRTRGSRGEVLRVLRAGRVAAIVGEQRNRPRASRRALASYHAVVEQLAREFPALVPSRFGSTFVDPAELRFVLVARRETFLRILGRVRHRWQMTVRFVNEEAVAPRYEPVDRRSGASYLRSLAANSQAVSRMPCVAAVRAAASRWMRAERIEARGRVVTLYHLVPRARTGAYRRAMSRLEGLLVSGPFAPYAFAETFV
jgi:hypothetical protein